jgi:hypothetical protein
LFLKPAQHLSEDPRGQLSGSTRARNHFSQTHGSFSFRVDLIWSDSASHRPHALVNKGCRHGIGRIGQLKIAQLFSECVRSRTVMEGQHREHILIRARW